MSFSTIGPARIVVFSDIIFFLLFSTMDESDGPADDVSLKTVLDAVNRQSKNIEAIIEAKVSEKNRCFER